MRALAACGSLACSTDAVADLVQGVLEGGTLEPGSFPMDVRSASQVKDAGE
jgi:hypothetical protein